jgi:hypothetical protein
MAARSPATYFFRWPACRWRRYRQYPCDDDAAQHSGDFRDRHITGEIRADHIIINGSVKGPIHASVMLELQPKARIEGDVHYAALEMHQGAT